jgi:hypothetical protein
MDHIIKYDLNKKAAFVSIQLLGGLRIRYHFLLLKPSGGGEMLKEWKGKNFDREKDEFSIAFKDDKLKFAPLSWQFDIFPNPNIPGEMYKIKFDITQEGNSIFTREYGPSEISSPRILTEDAVFVPNA